MFQNWGPQNPTVVIAAAKTKVIILNTFSGNFTGRRAKIEIDAPASVELRHAPIRMHKLNGMCSSPA